LYLLGALNRKEALNNNGVKIYGATHVRYAGGYPPRVAEEGKGGSGSSIAAPVITESYSITSVIQFAISDTATG